MTKDKIKTALVSVSDKQGLEKIAKYLFKNDILVFSSGGTYDYLKKIDPRLKLVEVSSYTKFKEILDFLLKKKKLEKKIVLLLLKEVNLKLLKMILKQKLVIQMF